MVYLIAMKTYLTVVLHVCMYVYSYAPELQFGVSHLVLVACVALVSVIGCYQVNNCVIIVLYVYKSKLGG